METSSMLITLFSLLTLLFQTFHFKIAVADGVAGWIYPSVLVGDSIKGEQLAIAVSPTQLGMVAFSPQTPQLAAPSPTSGGIISPSPTYTRPFHSKQGNSPSPAPSSGGVISPSPTYTRPFHSKQGSSPSPAPSSGGVISPSPTYTRPFHSKQVNSPSLAPSFRPTPATPSMLPDTGEGMPFVNSNPAVPLPTGEDDSAANHPLPISAHQGLQVEELVEFQIPLCILVWLMFYKCLF